MTEIRAYFDGSCWPNPHGLARYGFVVYCGDLRIHDASVEIGSGYGMTNNVAEAAGCRALLEYLLTQPLDFTHSVVIHGDSQVVLNVVSGKRKNPNGFFVNEAQHARFRFLELCTRTRVKLQWVPREMNTEADELTQGVALDQEFIQRLDREA